MELHFLVVLDLDALVTDCSNIYSTFAALNWVVNVEVLGGNTQIANSIVQIQTQLITGSIGYGK